MATAAKTALDGATSPLEIAGCAPSRQQQIHARTEEFLNLIILRRISYSSHRVLNATNPVEMSVVRAR